MPLRSMEVPTGAEAGYSGVVHPRLRQPWPYTMNWMKLIALMNWMLQTGDTARPEVFLQALARRPPQHEDIFMTTAQKLEEKGLEEGRMEGRIEGIQPGEQRGIEKGKLDVARMMLQNGLDRNTVMKMTGLPAEELAQIRH